MDTKTTGRALDLIAAKAELPASDIADDQTLEDLGLDSLHLMEMSVTVQREYGVRIPEGDLRLDQTVAEAVAYLTERMS